MSKDNNISRRKALAALGATGAAAAFGGAGTYAALSDSNSAEIILTGGTLLLKIDPKSQSFTPPDSYDEAQGEAVEHTATWTISNEGTINASTLLMEYISVSITNLNGATEAEVNEAAEITTFQYEGQDVASPPANLAELIIQLNSDGATRELSSTADDVPELPAFENETRELTIGITFDYSKVSGNGGFTVTATPGFSAQQ